MSLGTAGRGRRKFIGDVDLGFLGGTIEGCVQGPVLGDKCLRFVMADESGSIDVVAFGNLCQKFSGKVATNQNYRIMAFNTMKRNETYNKTNHPCQILLTGISQVEPINALSAVSHVERLRFCPIGQCVSITVIVYKIDSPAPTEKNPSPYQYTSLVDDALIEVELQIPPASKGALDNTEGSCVTLNNVKTIAYRDRFRLGFCSDTRVESGSQSDYGRMLQNWFHAEGLKKEYKRHLERF